jgi:hypothetical protein
MGALFAKVALVYPWKLLAAIVIKVHRLPTLAFVVGQDREGSRSVGSNSH